MTNIELKYPIPGDKTGSTSFTSGRNCEEIRRDPAGGWWIVIDSTIRHWQPDTHVSDVSELASAAPEPEPELPSYAELVKGGSYRCKVCARPVPSLAGLKIHYGHFHKDAG